jgi:hypothetical protein
MIRDSRSLKSFTIWDHSQAEVPLRYPVSIHEVEREKESLLASLAPTRLPIVAPLYFEMDIRGRSDRIWRELVIKTVPFWFQKLRNLHNRSPCVLHKTATSASPLFQSSKHADRSRHSGNRRTRARKTSVLPSDFDESAPLRSAPQSPRGGARPRHRAPARALGAVVSSPPHTRMAVP